MKPKMIQIILANFPTFLAEDISLAKTRTGNFGLRGVWGLDSFPLGKAKCSVLHMKSNGFALAMGTGNFGLRGSGA